MRTGRKRWAAALLATTTALTAALAGCGADAGEAPSAHSGAADRGPAGAVPQGAPGGAAPPAEAPPGAGKGTPPNLAVDRRSIVYRGSLTVSVPDVDTAAAAAAEAATAAGGFVSRDERSTTGADSGQASMELRVPADRFTGLVDRLAGLGTAERRGISTEDVTEQTVDLQARIATQRARVDSGRRLLAQAKSLADLLTLEKEVASREADLAALEGRQRRLADLTALSTVTLVLRDPPAAAAPPRERTGFLAGLADGWHALRASLTVLLTVLGAMLPFLLVLAVPGGGAWWAVRRRRRRTAAPG